MAEKKDVKKKKSNFKVFNPEKYINVKPVMNEAKKKSIVISFGRLNPITTGHEKLINKIISEAAARKAAAAVFMSHSQDKKKNPLTYEEKLEFATKAFGKVIRRSPARTIIEVMKELDGKYADIVVVVGSDRIREFETLLKKYNGKEFNFETIEVVSAGERDPDADDVSGMSASKLRGIAVEGNLAEFRRGLPKKLQIDAKKVYDAVRKGMGLTEEFVTEETLEEAPLTLAQRRKRGLQMKRIKSRLKVARQKARRRMASKDKLELRARRKAKQIIRNRLSKKSYGDMSPSEKIALDKRLSRIPQSVLDRIARKQFPTVRRAEIERLHRELNPSSKNEAFEEFYESYCSNDSPVYKAKKYHQTFTKEGKVKFDKRFKMYREKINPYFQESVEYEDLLEEILNLEGAVSEFVIAEKLEKDKDDPCWKGYTQLGMKKKGNREVPNCVPMKKEDLNSVFESRFVVEQEHVARTKLMIAREKAADREKHARMVDIAKRKDRSMRESLNKNDPSNREHGTDSLVKILKKDTPGQNLKEYSLNAPLMRGDRVRFQRNTITGVSETVEGTIVGSETYSHEGASDVNSSMGRLRVRDDSGKLYFVRHEDVDLIEATVSRGFEGKKITVKDEPARMIDGSMRKMPPAKSSSSKGGNGD
jgi:dephospho-CoA kinase